MKIIKVVAVRSNNLRLGRPTAPNSISAEPPAPSQTTLGKLTAIRKLPIGLPKI